MIRLVILLAGFVLTGADTASAQECLHGRSEVPEQRMRRQQALEVVHAINMAQATIVGPRTSTSGYRPLEELLNIPPLPPGFDLQFLTDGDGYIFSIKDTLDPCRYAVFSDQGTRVYEALPQVSPRPLPVVSGR